MRLPNSTNRYGIKHMQYRSELRRNHLSQEKYRFDSGTIGFKICPKPNSGAEMHDSVKEAYDSLRGTWGFGWFSYWWVLVISFWGGVVRVIKEHKLGEKTWKQIALIFICEMIVSGFVGVNTFFLAMSYDFRIEYCVFMTSVASYMGGRAITVFEAVFEAWVTIKRKAK